MTSLIITKYVAYIHDTRYKVHKSQFTTALLLIYRGCLVHLLISALILDHQYSVYCVGCASQHHIYDHQSELEGLKKTLPTSFEKLGVHGQFHQFIQACRKID